jgi:hypothetical protein
VYVGSATGQFGFLQCWCDYLTGNLKNTRHEIVLLKAGRTPNLRCIAHFVFEPESWLTLLHERLMMLYLGTVNDPRLRHPSHPESVFVNHRLYEVFDQIRSDCGLDAPLGPGLDSTWSFSQGWRSPRIESGTKCVNCFRVVLQPEDLLFTRRAWRYANQTKPKADRVKCNNCVIYLTIIGR